MQERPRLGRDGRRRGRLHRVDLVLEPVEARAEADSERRRLVRRAGS